MTAPGIEQRRTIRIRRSQLLSSKMDAIDKPAIKIAETFDEYRKTFNLVYDEYRHMRYTKPHPSKMLYNVWSMLPTTTVFDFKSHLNVIATMSHIRDTELFGLPMDAVYKDKIDELRFQGRQVAEIGALVTQRLRRWSNVMVFLSRAVFHYAKSSGVNDLVVMVNPKHVKFYTQIFLFKPFGEERPYDTVGAPAVALRVNLDNFEEQLSNAYSENDFETDMHAFFTQFKEPSLVGDANARGRRLLDPYSAYYFFRQRPEIISSLSESQLEYLRAIYHHGVFKDVPAGQRADVIRGSVAPVLEQMHLESRDEYLDTAFSRNLGLLDYAGQQKLKNTRVAVPGMGGVGGVHLMTLVRTGIGAFNLADFDAYSPANINRQYGADLSSFGRSKLDVMVERAINTNPFLDIRTFPDGVTDENIDEFLDGADILVDSLDFFVQKMRRKLFNRALQRNIPVITAAPAGYSCSLLVFMPGGMNYDSYFGVNDDTDPIEQLVRFTLGLTPKATNIKYTDRNFVDMRSKRVPSLGLACQICAGMAATEAIKIALGETPTAVIPASCQFDPYRGVLRKCRLPWGVNTPWQKFKVAVGTKLFIPPVPLGAGRPVKPEEVQAESAIPGAQMEYIMDAACRAPSGDNVQPWLFKQEGQHIELFINREADPSFFNFKQSASLLACGAALQNMEYAAGALGISSQTELFPEHENQDMVGRVHLNAQGIPFHEIMEAALWRRCTNRRMYSKKTVPAEVWDRLAVQADKNGDGLLLHCSSYDGMRDIAKAVYMADRVRVERQDLHEYLMKMVHFDPLPEDCQGDVCPDHFRRGMPLKNLQAGAMGELFLRTVKPWSRMKLANRLKIGRSMPLYSKMSVMRSGGIGMVCAQGCEEKHLLQAGRAVQRVWLALDQFGYALQPLEALPLLHLRLVSEGEQAFSREHVDLLNEAWELISKHFLMPMDCVPLFMFRTGRASGIHHRTYRQECGSLLTC